MCSSTCPAYTANKTCVTRTLQTAAAERVNYKIHSSNNSFTSNLMFLLSFFAVRLLLTGCGENMHHCFEALFCHPLPDRNGCLYEYANSQQPIHFDLQGSLVTVNGPLIISRCSPETSCVEARCKFQFQTLILSLATLLSTKTIVCHWQKHTARQPNWTSFPSAVLFIGP